MRSSMIGAFGAFFCCVTMNACEKACTLRGCEDSYSLVLESQAGALEVASYGFQVTFDGALVDDCVVVISDAAECGGGLCIVQNTCTLVDSVDNQMSGLQISTLLWNGEMPTTVGVNLSRDGEGILERTLTPSYSEFFPNGEECDETGCLTAEDSLTLPS